MKLTKKKAIQVLIARFQNELIAHGWRNLDDDDLAMMKALNIVKPTQ